SRLPRPVGRRHTDRRRRRQRHLAVRRAERQRPGPAGGHGQRGAAGASPDRNPGLFDAVRAGLGQVAVVPRATLRLVPAPRPLRRFLLLSPDLATMLADERLLAHEHRFERVQGAVLPTPRAAAGPSGSTSSRSPQRTRPTTPPYSPACTYGEAHA